MRLPRVNFRSEVLLSTMDLIYKHKLPYICTIAMTSLFQKKIVEEYDKYKYCFRCSMNSSYLGMYFGRVMGFIKKEFGFNKAYIITQDSLWAKATGQSLEKWYKEKGWELAGFDSYAIGASDFSPSLLKVRTQRAQVVVPILTCPRAEFF